MESLLTSRAALLQALVIPAYGLALIARVRTATRGAVCLRMGSVYPALRALERGGLVRSQVVRPSAGAGRPRSYYELTPAGVAVAATERAALTALLRSASIPPAEENVQRMRERVRRCARLSRSMRKLRRSMLARRAR